MNRREFLKLNVEASGNASPNSFVLEQNDWPLVANKSSLTRDEAAHLLRRFTMGPTLDLIDQFTGMSASEAADILLGDGLDHLPENESRLPNAEGDLTWLDTVEPHPRSTGSVDVMFQIIGRHRGRYNQLNQWWMQVMRDEDIDLTSPSREKFTLFLNMIWNVEFTYDTEDYIPPPLLYRHNKTLRRYHLGNYKDIALEMTLDGAYLLYQGLNESKGNPGEIPNENFMRELLELFTMGIANIEEEIPIYTENDIREGSRVLTGWRVPAHQGQVRPNGYFNTYFAPQFHDLGGKNVMKANIPPRNELDNTEFKVREEEVKRLIEILFEQKSVEISEFICEKVFTHFVYSNPNALDRAFISNMAGVFRDNDFELLPVFRYLIESDYFYDPTLIGIQIKNPVEFIVGLERALETNYGNARWSGINNLQMSLYDPPNVSGWIGYRTWMSTTTYPERANIARAIVESMGSSDGPTPTEFAQKFSNVDSFYGFTQQLVELLYPKMIDDQRLSSMVNYVKEQNSFSSDAEWQDFLSNNTSKADSIIKEILSLIVSNPDINLG